MDGNRRTRREKVKREVKGGIRDEDKRKTRRLWKKKSEEKK